MKLSQVKFTDPDGNKREYYTSKDVSRLAENIVVNSMDAILDDWIYLTRWQRIIKAIKDFNWRRIRWWDSEYWNS